MEANSTTAIDPREFRNAMGRFVTGVTIVTTQHDGRVHGMTANGFMSVSLDPPLVLISLGNNANMKHMLDASMRYGVSFLCGDQEKHSMHFAGKTQEDLDIKWARKGDMPLIEGAIGHIVARVVNAVPAGDHTLYIGQVELLEWRDDKPLVFYAGRYRQLVEVS
jgi:flavin reductase (DIM6/NTAB) family NADH-FMN oxidoreductase RutF